MYEPRYCNPRPIQPTKNVSLENQLDFKTNVCFLPFNVNNSCISLYTESIYQPSINEILIDCQYIYIFDS